MAPADLAVRRASHETHALCAQSTYPYWCSLLVPPRNCRATLRGTAGASSTGGPGSIGAGYSCEFSSSQSPLGTFSDLTINDWSPLPDSPPFKDKLSSGLSRTKPTWDFRNLAPPSSPPTSIDEEDDIDTVRHWPFARRIFGDLLDDRYFPALSDVLIETPNFEPEDWALLQANLQDRPLILRHFWFRYDRAMKRVISGSASSLHQHVATGCAQNIAQQTIMPVTQKFPVDGMMVTQNGAKMLVQKDHILVPDCLIGLTDRVKNNVLSLNLDADCVLVESARTESVPHVLAKVTDCMPVDATPVRTGVGRTYVDEMASEAGSDESEDAMEDETQTQTEDEDETQTQTEDDDGMQTLAGQENEHTVSSPLTPLQDPSSPLSPLSPGSMPSSTPPRLPPPLAPLPLQPAQEISSMVFMVVSTKEKAVKEPPPDVDISKKEWVELPCPDDKCLTGGHAYGGKIYVGEIRAYMWVFQGAEDHAYLAEHWKDDLEAWVRSGKALLLHRKYATPAQKAALLLWEARWRECMLTVREKVLHALIIAKSVQSSPEELEEFQKLFNPEPDMTLPRIKSPVGAVRKLVNTGSWRLAEERYEKQNQATTSYHFDGIIGSVKEAFVVGANLKRALDEGNLEAAQRALKRRHLDHAIVAKKSSLSDSEYLADGSSDPIASDPLHDPTFRPEADDGSYSQDSNYGDSESSQRGDSSQSTSSSQDASDSSREESDSQDESDSSQGSSL
ncbi:uncharacterized protein B0H18DRAFT_958844 [Fomitopsis serialis]|uniref:uncharacterized protein n=1 Tax=Fomitopsis serialis TaxID=139415 RepID=UPI002008E893|nr:uncharacterized protein B0H18DRAFT_958844 [Neoantrodia serialis]KAH9916437.1 hypothetical protein B0H18DRAFT_958844 [Neoantrodia serialis]